MACYNACSPRVAELDGQKRCGVRELPGAKSGDRGEFGCCGEIQVRILKLYYSDKLLDIVVHDTFELEESAVDRLITEWQYLGLNEQADAFLRIGRPVATNQLGSKDYRRNRRAHQKRFAKPAQ